MKSVKILAIAFSTLLLSCTGLKYSEAALTDDQSIKTEAVALLQKATESYTCHAAEVEKLKNHVNSALENEKKRKMNNATVGMWNEVMTAKGNLFDLLDFWKSKIKLAISLL